MIYGTQGREEVKIKNLDTMRINFMVAGVGGMGKSTFLKLFFKIYKKVALQSSSFAYNEGADGKTLKIGEIASFLLQANNMKLDIHLVDAPGFGDGINNQHDIDSIEEYLIKAHKKFSAMNCKVYTRQEIDSQDERIHCIFYFVPPHRMKDIDQAFIKKLSGLALIVPIIAKADTMTYQEHKKYLADVGNKLRLLQNVTKHPLVYDFQEEDSTFLMLDDMLACPAAEAKEVSEDESSLDPEVSVMSSVAAELSHHANYDMETDVHGDASMLQGFSVLSEEQEGTPSIGYADILAGLQHQHFSPISKKPTVVNCAPSVTSEGGDTSGEDPTELPPRTRPPLPRIPNVFAVVCDLSENGLREFLHGTIEINNPEHSDFRRLQALVFEHGTHLIKMRELTERMSIRLYQETCKEIPYVKEMKPVYKRVRDWLDHLVLWCVYTAAGLYVVKYIIGFWILGLH